MTAERNPVSDTIVGCDGVTRCFGCGVPVDAMHDRNCLVWLKQIKAERADMVNHPPHYTDHPSGVECIQITEHMGFCIGNAIKYLWRADLKGSAIEDLRKASWYIEREIERRTRSI
jgi:hypothetical protein